MPDPALQFVMEVDVLNVGVRAVLSHVLDVIFCYHLVMFPHTVPNVLRLKGY